MIATNASATMSHSALLTPPKDKNLGAHTARVILQAQTLRKELLLGELKAEELERR